MSWLETLGAEAETLRKKLKAAAELPELVRPYVDDGGQVKKLAFRVLNQFNPDAPVPHVPFTEEKQAEVTGPGSPADERHQRPGRPAGRRGRTVRQGSRLQRRCSSRRP